MESFQRNIFVIQEKVIPLHPLNSQETKRCVSSVG